MAGVEGRIVGSEPAGTSRKYSDLLRKYSDLLGFVCSISRGGDV